MKVFAYTAREPSGGIQRKTITATDRVDAIRQLRARGLVVVSVEEGQGASHSSRTLRVKPFLLALIPVSIVVGLFFVFSRNKDVHTSSAPETAKSPAVSVPVDRVVARPEVQPAVSPIAKPSLPAKKETVQKEKKVEKTNERPTTITPPSPVKKEVKPVEEPAVEPIRAAYLTATDKMLSLAVKIRPGEHMPELMITPDVDADFIQAINSDIWLYDDDTQEDYETKVAVAEIKQELKEYVEKGGSVSNFFAVLQRQRADEYKERMAEQIEFMRLSRVSKEEAMIFFQEANKRLAEKGIIPLRLPNTDNANR